MASDYHKDPSEWFHARMKPQTWWKRFWLRFGFKFHPKKPVKFGIKPLRINDPARHLHLPVRVMSLHPQTRREYLSLIESFTRETGKYPRDDMAGFNDYVIAANTRNIEQCFLPRRMRTPQPDNATRCYQCGKEITAEKPVYAVYLGKRETFCLHCFDEMTTSAIDYVQSLDPPAEVRDEVPGTGLVVEEDPNYVAELEKELVAAKHTVDKYRTQAAFWRHKYNEATR